MITSDYVSSELQIIYCKVKGFHSCGRCKFTNAKMKIKTGVFNIPQGKHNAYCSRHIDETGPTQMKQGDLNTGD